MKNYSSYNKRKHAKAFTFIEVLTALALIAITLPFIMSAITQATKLSTAATNHLTASTLAQSKLNQLIADGTWKTSDPDGDFEEEYPEQPQYNKFTWKFETQDHEEKQTLTHITIKIIWQSNNQPQTLQLSTTVFDPDNS